ncbi:MAG: hypothetical protein HKN23_03950 [Verrucomicrobiales bacterium]|nr:hypothetical protein [Verrucomicrobiales bacterium]
MIEQNKTHSNAIALMLVTVGGTAVAMVLVYTILTSRGNNLSQFAIYLAVAGFIGGFFNPRGMMYPFVIATVSLDLLKRLLILFDRPTVMDLYFVLGIAPLMILGIFCGTLVGGIFGKFEIQKRHLGLLAISILFIIASGIVAFRDLGAALALKAIADSAAYSILLFIVPVLFQNWEEFWKLIRFALFVFIPVGIYAIYQSIFGLSEFEISYLKSGLTIMVKELEDVRPRPFSTMNSAHTLAYLSAFLMALSLLPFAAGREFADRFRHRWVYAILSILFFCVCFVTLARSGHVLWVVAVGGLIAFATKSRVIAFYGGAVACFVSLVVFAEKLILKLPEWDAKLDKSTDFLAQATRIQTFYDRLYSYSQLKNADNYSLFGLDFEVFTHDAITESLVNYGVLPLAVLLIGSAFALRKLHRSILRIETAGIRRITSLLLGATMAIIVCDIFFGGAAKTFPLNAYMWIAMGGVLVVLFQQNREQTGSVRQSNPVDSFTPVQSFPAPAMPVRPSSAPTHPIHEYPV